MINLKRIQFAVLSFLLLFSLFVQNGFSEDVKRTAYAAFLPEPENFDGKLDDPVWANAPVISNFYNIEGTAIVNVQTEVRIIAAPEALWVGVTAFEPYMENIKNVQKKDGDSVWEDDSVELFFVLPDDIYDLRQFIVSAGGLRWMGYGKGTRVEPSDYPNWEVAVSRGTKEWTAEIIIPYHILGLQETPKSGDILSFNISRTRYAEGREYSSWSILYEPDFRRKEKYGFLRFGHQTEASNNAAEITPAVKPQSPESASGESFLVRAIDLAADFSCPLKVSGKMVQEFNVYAAIGEYESLPIAITNLTNTTEAYRVIIFGDEIKGVEQRGLKGTDGKVFPSDAIVMREALQVKDSDKSGYGLQFDPMPLMNSAYTITVPAGDTGLVWVTFDCKDAAPGEYSGFLRVIPLSLPGEYKTTYNGPLLDIPLNLTIWPIELSKEPPIPLTLFHTAVNPIFFKDMLEHGVNYIQVNSWSTLAVKFNEDGSLKEPVQWSDFREYVRRLDWAPEGTNPKIWLGYSLYTFFEGQLIKKNGFEFGSEEWKRAWSSYLQGIDTVLKEEGLTYDDYIVELIDEPDLDKPEILEKLKLASRIAKEAVPGMRMQLVIASRSYPLSAFKELDPYIDVWCIHNGKWNNAEFVSYLKELQNQGREIWFYICDQSMRGSLYRYYRLHAWKAFVRNLDGMGMWEYIGGPGGLYGADSWKVAQTGPLVYRSFDEPVTSIRYECLREGIDDVKYLFKLKSLIEMAKGKGINDSLIQEADEYLDEEPQNVVAQSYYEPYAEEVRHEVADYIMRIQELLKEI